jgi:predicted TIM-barrel fold metal-dependent hydrolase
MAFDAFGANRLTIGTDSPPSSHREGYGNVVRYLREYVGSRSHEEQKAVFGGTALSLFRFE